MRSLVFVCSLLACGPAWGEAHIGFEAKVKPVGGGFIWPNGPRTVVAIDRFYAGGKSRHAELFPGSTILAIDKVAVTHPKVIHWYCKRKKPGDEVVVMVRRNDRAVPVVVELVDGDEMRKGGFLDW